MIVNTLVIPDTHIPYHDTRALELVYKVVELVRPKRLVFIGDWVDNYACSQYLKDPTREARVVDELTYARDELHELTQLVPDYYFCEGNHEIRLPKFLATRAPELTGLVPSVREFWGIPESRWVPYYKHLTLDGVSYTHDLGHAGKGALRQSLDAFGEAIVFGHTHLGGVSHDADVHGRGRFALNVGWLGDPTHIDYRHRAKCRSWSTGFGWVAQARIGTKVVTTATTATFVPIQNQTAVVEGQAIQ